MNEDTIKSMSDADLPRFIALAQGEVAARARKRKEDTIAKIRELAGAAGVSVLIKGARGRPAHSASSRKSSKAAQVK